MYIRTLSDGLLRIHIHDEDSYEVTDDNGVTIDLTPRQQMRLANAITKKIPGYRPRRS